MPVWIEEEDKRVWHRVQPRSDAKGYRAACGWEIQPIRGRIWPQRRNEVGPAHPERCRSCVDHPSSSDPESHRVP